ncbi:NADH-quinone oxidoreductase subunit M [Streptosporangium sp. NPDC049078]|uniref:complex I subunit 4 family protein n=1 Tax=Streptosporangium sp. NPDC049078 TaxID=3155767 RepID=UPI003426F433
MSWLLIALLGVPLAGAAALLALPGADVAARRRLLRVHGLVVSGLTFALSVLLAATFDYGNAARPQFVTDLAWIPGLDLRFHLGVDGISLPLVVLTTLLTFLCFVYLCRGSAEGPGQLLAPRPGGNRPRALVFTLLVLEVGMIGTFLALDLLLFFVFFEVVLIPMYFVIAVWGGRARRAAAIKFILYTLLGSVVLLLGLLLIWSQTGTLDMTALAQARGAGMSPSVQTLAFLAVGIGFAVKAPMWPLHTWLPDAHTEAPTVGSVLLAGVLLKMGTYGIARVAIPILPDGAVAVAPWLGAFAVVGIVYGSLACLAQRDLKRMIAYSSVGHMGFVLLGFATLTPAGVNGALFGNIAHGLITALLFFVAGAIKERYGTSDMPALGGGMMTRLPRLASLLTFACVASLGLPGLAGFWGEMLALLGAFEPAAGLSRPLYLVFMALGGLGTVLTAAYFLLMLSRVTHGRSTETVHVPVLAGVTAGGLPSTGPTGEETDHRENDREEGAPTPEADEKEGIPVATGGGGDASSPGAISAATSETVAGTVSETASAVTSGTTSTTRSRMPDVTGYELAAWVPLIALILLFGLWPKALLLLTDPVVRTLVGAP